jgi:hypothetical protein
MALFSKYKITTASITADSQFSAFMVVMRLINAALTFCFGYTNGAATFDTGDQQISAILGGLAYATILDAAAFGWESAGKRKGISPKQRAIADGMSSSAMWASTIISGVQLILTTKLVTIAQSTRDNIGLLALMLITGLLAAHFLRLFAYLRNSPEAIDSRIEGEMRSTLSAMLQEAKANQAEMITEQVAQYITDHTSKIVALESRKTFNNLLVEMGHADQVAGPQVQEKLESKVKEPPTPPEDATVEEEEVVADQDPIDFAELTGKARAAQEGNLNMAAG